MFSEIFDIFNSSISNMSDIQKKFFFLNYPLKLTYKNDPTAPISVQLLDLILGHHKTNFGIHFNERNDALEWINGLSDTTKLDIIAKNCLFKNFSYIQYTKNSNMRLTSSDLFHYKSQNLSFLCTYTNKRICDLGYSFIVTRTDGNKFLCEILLKAFVNNARLTH